MAMDGLAAVVKHIVPTNEYDGVVPIGGGKSSQAYTVVFGSYCMYGLGAAKPTDDDYPSAYVQ